MHQTQGTGIYLQEVLNTYLLMKLTNLSASGQESGGLI